MGPFLQLKISTHLCFWKSLWKSRGQKFPLFSAWQQEGASEHSLGSMIQGGHFLKCYRALLRVTGCGGERLDLGGVGCLASSEHT